AFRRRRLGIEQAAQRQGDRAELTRERQRFGLLRIKFDGGGLADRDLLAFLVFDRLVDREHPHVPQYRFAGGFLDAGNLLRPFVAAGEDYVDMIVLQDEAAGVVIRRDVERDRAHAMRENGGHEATALG